MDYSTRIAALRKCLNKDADAVLITNLKNIRYLCGFTGSNGILLVTSRRSVFFTDFRYREQSVKQIGDIAKIVIINSSMNTEIIKFLAKNKYKNVLVEKTMTLKQFLSFTDEFNGKLVPIDGIVEKIREIKDNDEVRFLKKAFKIADDSFSDLVKIIKPGMRETEIAAHLEFFMKVNGSEGESFPTIIASGSNSAFPHAQVTDRKVKKGEMLKIDFGAIWQGYHSDMTRTLFLGRATEKFKEIYDIVLTAQKKAIDAIKAGTICKVIDAVARDHIKAAGYGDYFGHGLGHSLGLDVHEQPFLSSLCDMEIKSGMTFTVEPGIYIPGWGGIRIEDVYLVKERGLLRLTNSDNALKEL